MLAQNFLQLFLSALYFVSISLFCKILNLAGDILAWRTVWYFSLLYSRETQQRVLVIFREGSFNTRGGMVFFIIFKNFDMPPLQTLHGRTFSTWPPPLGRWCGQLFFDMAPPRLLTRPTFFYMPPPQAQRQNFST